MTATNFVTCCDKRAHRTRRVYEFVHMLHEAMLLGSTDTLCTKQTRHVESSANKKITRKPNTNINYAVRLVVVLYDVQKLK